MWDDKAMDVWNLLRIPRTGWLLHWKWSKSTCKSLFIAVFQVGSSRSAEGVAAFKNLCSTGIIQSAQLYNTISTTVQYNQHTGQQQTAVHGLARQRERNNMTYPAVSWGDLHTVQQDQRALSLSLSPSLSLSVIWYLFISSLARTSC